MRPIIPSNLRPAPREGETKVESGYFSQAAFAMSLIVGLLLGLSITRIQAAVPGGGKRRTLAAARKDPALY